MDTANRELVIVDARTMLVDGIAAAARRSFTHFSVVHDGPSHPSSVRVTVFGTDPTAAPHVDEGARVVVLSARPTGTGIRRLLAMGVLGHVCEAESLTHLVQAIDDAFDGESYLSPATRAILDEPDAAAIHLTARELEVARLHVSDEGHSIVQVAELLGLSPETVRSHLVRLRARFSASGYEVQSRAALRAALLETGLLERG
jgi:DNA-binding NarL/FixJ family response regulator